MNMSDRLNLAKFFSKDDKVSKWDIRFVNTIIVSLFTIFICLLGLVVNGTLLWFLGFHVKRNPFTTYILNVTLSDFMILLLSFHVHIFLILRYLEYVGLWKIYYICTILLYFVYSSGQLLMTAFSIDRGVFVLFPNWYHGQRLPHLPTIVCALIWILFCIICGIELYTYFTQHFIYFDILGDRCIVLFSVCLTLMTIFALILFFKVCFKSHQGQHRKLLVAYLLTIVFSLFSFLTIVFLLFFGTLIYVLLCVALKSAINPLIYFVVGCWKAGRFQESMKATFQKVFKEAEPQSPAQGPL